MIAGEGGTQNSESNNGFEIQRQGAIARSLYGNTDKIYIRIMLSNEMNDTCTEVEKKKLVLGVTCRCRS